ncbi:MAG: undecaprenyldiphospho-muramoylpentapeptide beta-N-acetylglucosaminyltransferase [Gammaproteobacteria bacterium]|nr:MAG: undecaprenyldiphospho-muramoylpentapeptide beta-N-acetylglucosaminyltransferase [Gammaproteobacteria bacterium]
MTTRILIMAGGTGGHVFPALAVAEELRAQNVEVQWMGTARGIEAKLVPEAGIPLNNISVQGLRGNGALGWLLAPFKVAKAIFEAMSVIRRFKPDAVLGLGGFASGPGGIAAKLMGKPLIIHEQNAIPGLTNRTLARVANAVLEGFPNSFKSSAKVQWLGNPVRASIESMATPTQRFDTHSGDIRVLVLGGSLGAKSLNTLLPQAFAAIDQPLLIKHQCGVRHSDDCQKNYNDAAVDVEVMSFIDDMAAVYAWADLVICRAGALTIAELSAAGVGSLLVPYPYAVDDHQRYNAAALVEAGAAKLLIEKDLTVDILKQEIEAVVANRSNLLAMANNARSLAKDGTAKQIAAICLELAHA